VWEAAINRDSKGGQGGKRKGKMREGEGEEINENQSSPVQKKM
jgi:hypothetical protein